MLNKHREQLVLATVIVCLLFVVYTFIAYIYMLNKSISVTENDVIFNYIDSTELYLSSTLPISDILGKKYNGEESERGIHIYKKFSITNISLSKRKYEIYVNNLNYNNTLSDNYIKLYLTDYDDNPFEGFEKNLIPSYVQLKDISNKSGYKLLYAGELLSGKNQNFILRGWVSDSYGNITSNENFTFDIAVRAV